MKRGVWQPWKRQLSILVCVLGIGGLVLGVASCDLFNESPVATFSIGPGTTGTAPFHVILTGTSTDPDEDDLVYTWKFGDGSPDAVGQASEHTYTQVGTWTIILIVTDSHGASDQTQMDVYVTAAAPAGPTAEFTVTPTSGTSPLPVTVDASGSTYAVAAIDSYAWVFGDGQTGLGRTASHMYVSSSTQTYTITLTVTGADGKTGRATKQVRVTAPGGGTVAGNPSAQFVMVPDKGVAPLYVLFDPKDSEADTGRTLTNYVWTFGDGESGYSMNPNEIPHTYVTTKASQVFTAMLLVLDNENADDHITKPVKAYNFQPVAGFEIANPPGGDGTPPAGVLFYATEVAAAAGAWEHDDVFYGNLGTGTITVKVWIRSKYIPDARWQNLARQDPLTHTLKQQQAELQTATGSALSSITSVTPTGYTDHNYSYDPEGQVWTTALPPWFGTNPSWGIKSISVNWGEGAPAEEAYSGTTDNLLSHDYTFSPGGVSTAVPRTVTVTVTDFLGAKASWSRKVWLKSGEELPGEK